MGGRIPDFNATNGPHLTAEASSVKLVSWGQVSCGNNDSKMYTELEHLHKLIWELRIALISNNLAHIPPSLPAKMCIIICIRCKLYCNCHSLTSTTSSNSTQLKSLVRHGNEQKPPTTKSNYMKEQNIKTKDGSLYT